MQERRSTVDGTGEQRTFLTRPVRRGETARMATTSTDRREGLLQAVDAGRDAVAQIPDPLALARLEPRELEKSINVGGQK